MPHVDFVHLRVHSAYSLSESAIRIKDMVKMCAKHDEPAIAVTDTGNLFGAMEFSTAAPDYGVQPILGTVLAVAPLAAVNAFTLNTTFDSVVLLVQNQAGYMNLMGLISRSFLETERGEKPHVTWDMFDGATEGLIVLTGGPNGPVGRPLQTGHKDEAEAALLRLKALFPDRVYMELMRHGLAEEDNIEAALIDLAYAHDIPLVATNDCYFPDESYYEAHDALLCIAEGKFVSDTDRRRVTPEHRLKSAAEMRELFADLPEAVDNTLVIAQRCSFLLKGVKPLLPPFPTEGGRTEVEELRAQAAEGLEHRLEKHVFPPNATPEEKEEIAKPYHDRLEYELGVIIQMKFPGYFLIVSDFIKWSKAHDIPVGPGRGSGAGSVVAWALSITDLNPLQFGLLFERFLNPERVSMPDFDVDFCQDRRDEVIRYVQHRYGHDKVAQIITFGKLQARAVVRDVGRVLQMSYGHVDKICKLIPNNPAQPVTLQEAIDGEPALQDLRDKDEQVKHLIGVALKLEGLYRHASTHAAGVVIGDRPLHQLVALYQDPRSELPATQFNMKYVEQTGLIKYDFLGLKTLTVLQRAVKLIAQRGPEPEWQIDLAAIPIDDEKTYAMLGRGETVGVFQFESTGMRDSMKRMKPNRLEDLIALGALYRPGPMDNIPKYIRVKNGDEPADYMHPLLEPCLKETFGIIVYQEQVMEIAKVLAGYSLGGADLLRRAMGKKIKEEMEKQRQIFIDGAVQRGVDGDQAGTIFDHVNKFASYGFNKSHAAAYGLVAYQTAWLKANFPVEFMAASMTLDMGNTDKLNIFRQELGRLKVTLLTPDVNHSDPVFKVEMLPDGTRAIRYALAAVKGVGQQAMESLVAERNANGPFKDLFDFARRLDIKVMNKRQMENLACAGAFDSLNPNRAQVYESLETLLAYAHSAADEQDSGQVSLFGGGAATTLKLPDLKAVKDWDSLERLSHEFKAIGFYLSAHPLDGFAKSLKRLSVQSCAAVLSKSTSGKGSVRMAGIVSAKKERVSKNGNRFAFVELSDPTGLFEVMLFSEILAASRPLLEAGRALVLTVDAQQNGDDVRLSCNAIEPLEEAVARTAEGLEITINHPDAVPLLHEKIAALPHGRGKIWVRVETETMSHIDILLPATYQIPPTFRAQLRGVTGIMEINDL